MIFFNLLRIFKLIDDVVSVVNDDIEVEVFISGYENLLENSI